jgi:hypothetical protein
MDNAIPEARTTKMAAIQRNYEAYQRVLHLVEGTNLKDKKQVRVGS